MNTVLTDLYDAVVARFELEVAEGERPEQLFGWKAPRQQTRSARRIVWTPGDAGGSLGTIGAGKFPARFPRAIANLEELCTVELHALNEATPDDERAQYEAARALFDAWWRAVFLEAIRLGIGPGGGVRLLSQAWAAGPRGRRSGEMIRAVIAVSTPITDATPSFTETTADQAQIAVAHGDLTENLTVTPEVQT